MNLLEAAHSAAAEAWSAPFDPLCTAHVHRNGINQQIHGETLSRPSESSRKSGRIERRMQIVEVQVDQRQKGAHNLNRVRESEA